MEAHSSGTDYRSEFHIAPDGDNATSAMIFDGQPSGSGGRIMVVTSAVGPTT